METWLSPLSKWFYADQSQTPVVTVTDRSNPPQLAGEDNPVQGQDELQEHVVEQGQAEDCQDHQYPIESTSEQQEAAAYDGTHSDPMQESWAALEIKDAPTDSKTEGVLLEPTSNGSTLDVPLQHTFADSSPVSLENMPVTSPPAPIIEGESVVVEETHQIHQQDIPDTADSQEAEIPLRQKVNLRPIIRALGWMFSGNKHSETSKHGSTETETENQAQNGSTTDTHSKRRSKHQKPPPPPPPRPTISRTRLKVFVGTWNMMGQLPGIRDGLKGFLDIDNPAHSEESHDHLDHSQKKPHSDPVSHSYPPEPSTESNTTLEQSHADSFDTDSQSKDQAQRKKASFLKRFRRGSNVRRVSLTPSLSTPNLHGPQANPSPSQPPSQPPSGPGILKEPFLEMNTRSPYHIIAINTQECEREIREAVIFPSKPLWESHLQTLLGPDYVLVKTETMAALHLAVFVWKPIEDLITAVDSSTVATGIGGIVGNKGAVAVSLYLGSMSFLFVNAHLTAHQSNTQARNSDYKRIVQELQLNDAPKGLPGRWYFKGDMKLRRHYNSPAPVLARQKSFQLGSGGNGRGNSGQNGRVSKPGAECHPSNITIQLHGGNSNNHSIDQSGKSSGDLSNQTLAQSNSGVVDITDQFDYTFWAGDLNYRVDLSREEAEECLERGDLKTMLAHDQLTTERNKGAVFNGFMEAPIDFKPTYKFDPLTPESDSRVRRNRQWTLKGRPKSMLNFSFELTPMPPTATLYRLEHNKSCPTLSLGANDDAKYPNLFSLKRSLESQDSSKPTESGNANDGSCDNMKGKGHENETKIEEDRRVAKQDEATEIKIRNDAQRYHNKTLGRKLSISRAFKSVHRRPSAVRTSLSPPHQHKRRHSVCFKIEDAAFDDLHDGQTQESRKQGSSMTLHDGCVSHERKNGNWRKNNSWRW
ncbi:MAG: hypothetical protein J3Q66DRAFT_113284 [Benniella sp.]|nr:MAG: hypothetical protein J3Q66DRAFT_113284 [Benniella sp.]